MRRAAVDEDEKGRRKIRGHAPVSHCPWPERLQGLDGKDTEYFRDRAQKMLFGLAL
jgi:hypothetical protein